MWQKVKVWWSLWRYSFPAGVNAIASLVCYWIGWHLSCAGSAMPLARAGAAATAIAIGITLYDYRTALQKSEQNAKTYFERFTSKLPLTGEASQHRVGEMLRHNSVFAIRVIASVDAGILMLATFVWGFGDLATRWM